MSKPVNERTHKQRVTDERQRTGVKRTLTHPKRQARQQRADQRRNQRQGRSNLAQLKLLDTRPGKSRRERSRLTNIKNKERS